MGKMAMLVTTRQGSPGVSFMGLTVLPKSVRGRVVPPNPMIVKRVESILKGGGQLAM